MPRAVFSARLPDVPRRQARPPNRACRRMLRPRPVSPRPAGAAPCRTWNRHGAPKPAAVIHVTDATVAPARRAPSGDTLPAAPAETRCRRGWLCFPSPTWIHTGDPRHRYQAAGVSRIRKLAGRAGAGPDRAGARRWGKPSGSGVLALSWGGRSPGPEHAQSHCPTLGKPQDAPKIGGPSSRWGVRTKGPAGTAPARRRRSLR